MGDVDPWLFRCRGEAPPGCWPGNELGDAGADRTSGGRGENGLCPGAMSPGGVRPVAPLPTFFSIRAGIWVDGAGHFVAAAFNRLVNFSNRETSARVWSLTCWRRRLFVSDFSSCLSERRDFDSNLNCTERLAFKSDLSSEERLATEFELKSRERRLFCSALNSTVLVDTLGIFIPTSTLGCKVNFLAFLPPLSSLGVLLEFSVSRCVLMRLFISGESLLSLSLSSSVMKSLISLFITVLVPPLDCGDSTWPMGNGISCPGRGPAPPTLMGCETFPWVCVLVLLLGSSAAWWEPVTSAWGRVGCCRFMVWVSVLPFSRTVGWSPEVPGCLSVVSRWFFPGGEPCFSAVWPPLSAVSVPAYNIQSKTVQ